jgi:hypothetical protein
MRPTEFWMGPSSDPAVDFDSECIGYPTGESVPEEWEEEARNYYDTTRPGLGNYGHDEWLTAPDGSPLFSESERRDLLEFLKTL